MYEDKGFKYGRMPKSIGCYICGKQYGTASILIHLKSCQKKWEVQESHKPKKMRRACPMPPPGFLERLGKKKVNQSELDDLNALAFQNYNEQALLKCQHCERSFNPQSYQIHKKMCFADKPFKPLNKSVARKPQVSEENNDYNSKKNRYKTPNVDSYKRHEKQEQYKQPSTKNYQSRSQVPQQQKTQNQVYSDISKKEIFDKKKYQKSKTPVFISEGTQTIESTLQNNKRNETSIQTSTMPTRDSSTSYSRNRNQNNKQDQYKSLAKTNNFNSKPKQTEKQKKAEEQLESFIAQHFTKQPKKQQKPNKPNNRNNFQKVKKIEYEQPEYDQQDYYEQPLLLGMERCKKCNRTFANDRIEKHQSVCVANKKPRKVRRFHKPPPKKQIAREKAQLKSKWRDQHKEFQANLKYMRKLKKAEDQGIALVNIPPPPPSQNNSFTPCKYCGRKFNSKAHARHEPVCQSIINKPKPLKRKRY